MTKRLIVGFLVLFIFSVTNAQKQESGKEEHFVCAQSAGIYHDNSHCASLMLCTGGKVRRVKDVGSRTPCPKCAKPKEKIINSGFTDIKRVLGVKDRKQIKDSLGTDQSTIHRPDGFSLRISGLPGSKTVNAIEFYFDEPVVFNEDSLFSPSLYEKLGLKFNACRADTIRNTTPHPVTGKVKKDVTIEYRGCAIVEKRDQYEDISKYFYELIFVARESDRGTELEKVVLNLKIDP